MVMYRLVGVGIFRGELIFGAQNTFDRVTSNETLTSFPPSPSAVGKKSEKLVPLSIVITEFHWLVLYTNKIQAINKLNEEVVFETILPDEIGQPLGLAKDVRRNSYWLFGSQKIMEIAITEEGRNIWALYLSKGLFEQAILFCQVLFLFICKIIKHFSDNDGDGDEVIMILIMVMMTTTTTTTTIILILIIIILIIIIRSGII
jgi:hypothetical protein